MYRVHTCDGPVRTEAEKAGRTQTEKEGKAVDNADNIWNWHLTRRDLMASVAAGGAGLALVGCGDDDEDTGAGGATQAADTPTKGGKLTLLTGRAMTINDPHTRAAGIAIEADLGEYGRIWCNGPKVQFSDAVARAPTLPGLGQHSASVLSEFGYDQGDIERLITAGVTKGAATPA
ncbi:MAG: hypothetical protein EXR43_00350 [Dehalococcoidia bacterium]|nr:hypothetical protein [Dehalococcoidia bacterium]